MTVLWGMWLYQLNNANGRLHRIANEKKKKKQSGGYTTDIFSLAVGSCVQCKLFYQVKYMELHLFWLCYAQFIYTGPHTPTCGLWRHVNNTIILPFRYLYLNALVSHWRMILLFFLKWFHSEAVITFVFTSALQADGPGLEPQGNHTFVSVDLLFTQQFSQCGINKILIYLSLRPLVWCDTICLC